MANLLQRAEKTTVETFKYNVDKKALDYKVVATDRVNPDCIVEITFTNKELSNVDWNFRFTSQEAEWALKGQIASLIEDLRLSYLNPSA